MSHRQRGRRWVVLAVLATVVTLVAQPSSQADDDWYPGIPANDGTVDEQWTNAASGGMGYSTLAKQWFRTPVQMATARTRMPPPEPAVVDPVTGVKTVTYPVVAKALLVSPEGAPANYGYMAPVTVRSVGFGLMPVEATLQVSQRRKDGYPVPLSVNLYGDWAYPPDGSADPQFVSAAMRPTVVDDAFNVQILDIKIDGVDIGLTGDCRTVTPAPVHLVGPAYKIDYPDRYPTYQAEWYATHDPKTYYNPFYGGYMAGTITIPPFTGCTTAAGDDLSALMTTSASGPDNPIEATSGWPCGNEIDGAAWPPAPGDNTPKKAGCEGVTPLPYPARGSD